MADRKYRKLLGQAEYEALHGSRATRQEAGERHLPQLLEASKQVAEDRGNLTFQWRALKEAWNEPYGPDQEPHRDETKAVKGFNWRLGAWFMFAIEVTFASWLASTYLALAVLPGGRLLRALALTLLGVLLTGAASLLFHKLMAVHDDEKRPEQSYRRFARIAAWSSATGLVAVAAFLLTRHLLIGGPVLVLGLGVLTLGLAAGVAASFHCAEILRRPNRVAALYDAADKLLGRLRILIDQIRGRAPRHGGEPAAQVAGQPEVAGHA